MKKIICYLKAIPFFIRSGVWCPHVYGENVYEPTIIIATQNHFRVSKDYIHNEHEKVYPNATLIKNKCIYCGHEITSWYNGKIDEMPVINTKLCKNEEDYDY